MLNLIKRVIGHDPDKLAAATMVFAGYIISWLVAIFSTSPSLLTVAILLVGIGSAALGVVLLFLAHTILSDFFEKLGDK